MPLKNCSGVPDLENQTPSARPIPRNGNWWRNQFSRFILLQTASLQLCAFGLKPFKNHWSIVTSLTYMCFFPSIFCYAHFERCFSMYGSCYAYPDLCIECWFADDNLDWKRGICIIQSNCTVVCSTFSCLMDMDDRVGTMGIT